MQMISYAMGRLDLAIVAASLMPLLASCASQEAVHAPPQGITAIYSPSVRLSGKGSLIFLQTPAPPQRVPPAPPAELTADYMPGPWSIFFEAKTDRPTEDAQYALKQIAEMASILPTIGVYLCSVGPSQPIVPDVGDRKRLDAVRALLTRYGIQQAKVGPDRLCKSLSPRPEPIVWIVPATN